MSYQSLKHKDMAFINDTIDIGKLTFDVNFEGTVFSESDHSSHDGHERTEIHYFCEFEATLIEVWSDDDLFYTPLPEHRIILDKWIAENYTEISNDLINQDLF